MLAKHNRVSLPGILFVLALHGALFYVLWNQRINITPVKLSKINVSFVTKQKMEEVHKVDTPLLPPKPKLKPKPKPKLKPKLKPKPKPKLTPKPDIKLVRKSEPQESVAEEVVEEVEASVPETAPVPAPSAPVTLLTELSVTCPTLSPPSYPALSRRLGEEGKLVLRVELDKKGRVSEASVAESSTYKRLDDAALAVVKTWRCNPALRNGKPVRAIALQPFNFVLQGN
tara:strand:- start:31032 stop:31715 length:684 start_codon:yes stop_codon:yes gene_type:complete